MGKDIGYIISVYHKLRDFEEGRKPLIEAKKVSDILVKYLEFGILDDSDLAEVEHYEILLEGLT